MNLIRIGKNQNHFKSRKIQRSHARWKYIRWKSSSLKYIGDDSEIDELIVFGVSPEYGFAIVRVLGDDMELSKIMKLRTCRGSV